MAGQAEKKRAKNAESSIQYFQLAVLIVNVLYLLMVAVLGSREVAVAKGGESSGAEGATATVSGLGSFLADSSELFYLAWYSVVTYFTYGGIARALGLGVGYESYQDVFALNLFVQFLCCFSWGSSWAWYLYLAVPAVAIYKLWGFVGPFLMGGGLGGMMGGSGEQEQEMANPADQKRAAKRARDAQKEKYKYMKG
eukprot:gene362-163_t